MLHALLLTLGVCNDQSTSCYTWFLDGQCESNSAFMHKNCPLSCNICEHTNCTDTQTDCTYWARKGECENNTDFMLRTCPTACGLCTPKCQDTHGGYQTGPSAEETMCDKWAKQCKPRCKDVHAQCPAWAAGGECTSNAEFMLKHCPSACDVCANATSHLASAAEEAALRSGGAAGTAEADKKAAERLASPGGCHDVNEECSRWVGSGECTTNPHFMLRHCAESCGLCTTVCTDHDERCPGWAQLQDGHECDTNKGFMQKTCPASCGVCSELQKHLASTLTKEEL